MKKALLAGLAVVSALALAITALILLLGDFRSDQEKIEDALLALPFRVELLDVEVPEGVEGLVAGHAYVPGSQQGEKFVIAVGGSLEPTELTRYLAKPRPGLYDARFGLQVRWQRAGDTDMRFEVQDAACRALSGDDCPF
jgi:hypothetical protein